MVSAISFLYELGTSLKLWLINKKSIKLHRIPVLKEILDTTVIFLKNNYNNINFNENYVLKKIYNYIHILSELPAATLKCKMFA